MECIWLEVNALHGFIGYSLTCLIYSFRFLLGYYHVVRFPNGRKKPKAEPHANCRDHQQLELETYGSTEMVTPVGLGFPCPTVT